MFLYKLLRNFLSKSATNVKGTNNSPFDSSQTNSLHVIMARGFPWKISQADVGTFFQNIQIIGGNSGIHLRKNGAMEAFFCVESKKGVEDALSQYTVCNQ